MNGWTIVRAAPEQTGEARRLFEEYAASLGIDLCFQGFDRELEDLPGGYAPPRGLLLLALDGGQSAGCIALRPLDAETCEMKRLYVRPAWRGSKLGLALIERIIRDATDMGYRRMRLDTLPFMERAIAIYRHFGFVEIAPYRPNPVAGALFFELQLGPLEVKSDGSSHAAG